MAPISRLCFPVLLLMLIPGCGDSEGGEELPLPITEESYVAAMADLARVRRHPPRGRGQYERERLADSVRTDALLRHGVTAEELIAFADVVGSDPGRMQSLTERIESFADSLEADSLRADSIAASLEADSLRADSVAASLEADSLRADSVRADSGEADSLVADSMRADPVERVGGRDREPRFADPGAAPAAASGRQIDSTAVDGDTLPAADEALGSDSVPAPGAAPIRPRSGNARRPGRRPPPTPDPDSASGR
jgi:hypothetical protein